MLGIMKAVCTYHVIQCQESLLPTRSSQYTINPSVESKARSGNQTYALTALAPNIALIIVKSSSLICATIVLGANTPAAKSAPPNNVPAAYSETSDGICLSFVCDCFERYDRQRSVPRCVSRGGMKEMVPRVQRGGQRELRDGG